MTRQSLKIRAAHWAGVAVRVLRVLFAPAAAAAVSIGLGQLAACIWHRGQPWVTLTLAGLFGLWVASELNAAPPPRRDGQEDLSCVML